MGRFLTRSWFLALPLAAATMAACNDDGATLYVPNPPLAVGAYYGLGFGDACGASEGCTTQHVTQIVEADTDDPSVAVVILAQDHPAGALARHQYYVLGKKAGHTSVVFKAMFDDGSLREAKAGLSVQAADTLRLASRCGDGSQPSPTNVLVAVGQGGSLYVEAYAGNSQLGGWLPDAVTADGLTDDFMDNDLMFYGWQAPSTPVVLQPRSAAVPKVDGTLTAYGPDQVTEIVLASANSSPAAFTQPGDFYLTTAVRVDGHAPCQSLPVELHSSTPSICSGPSGETVWVADSELGTHATVHAEGACVLGAAMPGGPVLTTQTFPIFFVQTPLAGSDTPGFDQPCPVEGQTACAGIASYEVGVCQAGHWMLKNQCPLDQTCDYVPDSTPGCASGTTCARCRGLR